MKKIIIFIVISLLVFGTGVFILFNNPSIIPLPNNNGKTNNTLSSEHLIEKDNFDQLAKRTEEIFVSLGFGTDHKTYVKQLEKLCFEADNFNFNDENKEIFICFKTLINAVYSYKNVDAAEKALGETLEKYESINFHNKPVFDRLTLFLAANAVRLYHKTLDTNTAVLSFVGDTSFGTFPQAKQDRKFDYVFENTANGDYEYFFKYCKAFFHGDDLTIMNIETAISNRTRMKPKEWPIKSDPKFTKLLNIAGVEVANLANNHTYDCYDEGYQDTVESLESHNIKYFNDDKPLFYSIKDLDFVFLGYSILISEQSPSLKAKIITDIEKYKTDNNFIIVNCHWGQEYSEQPLLYQTEYARAFIDAGADLIIGTHPHIMQGVELYNNKYIVYSMGDFLFGADPDLLSNMTAVFRFYVNTKTLAVDFEIIPFFENSDGVNVRSGGNNFQPLPLYGKSAKSVTDYLERISSPLKGGAVIFKYFDPFLIKQ